MSQTIAVITPAWRAQPTIVSTVRSVIAQSHEDWQLWIVADDELDYEQFLRAEGIADSRIRHLSSGGMGQGASNARNVALDAITTPYAAILDADDRLKPDKLARAMAGLATYGIVTTALEVMTDRFEHLRFVGQGPDRTLTPGAHKWTSLSMDSMLVWDRRKADGRYDPTMSNMTDLEFLLQLYRTVPQSLHLGTPLHDYIKRESSMSNGRDVAAGMIASKATIKTRLENGVYGLPASDVEALGQFLEISLKAERLYGAALAVQPDLLFEDHLEPMLHAKKAAR